MEFREKITDRLRNLMAAPLEKGSHRASVIAVASSKGGVGKTTTAVNLSVGLAREGVRTLLIDLDPQAHVAASLQLSAPTAHGLLSDVLLGKRRDVCEVTSPTPWPGLDVAGSDGTLAETEMILAAKIGKEMILDGTLTITRTRYDAVLIDCPPNLGTLTLNALCAACFLLIPSDMSVLALKGVGDIIAAMETLRSRLGRSLRLGGIVATRVDKRARTINDAIAQRFAELYGDHLMDTRIPQSSALNKAHLAGKPIFAYEGNSPGAAAYAALGREIIARFGISRSTPQPTQRSA